MRSFVLALLLPGGLLAACNPAAPDPATQGHHESQAGRIAVTDAWARATPASTTGAAYFTIINGTSETDVLLSAASSLAARTELHRSITEDGMARMRPAGEISIPAGTSLKAEPGHLHLMLMELRQPLEEGATLQLSLTFQKAGTIDVLVPVRPATAMAAHDQADAPHHAGN